MIRTCLLLTFALQYSLAGAEVGTFRHYKNLNDKEVETRANDLDPAAILEIGHRGKQSDIDKLKQIAASMNPDAKELESARLPGGKVDAKHEMSIRMRHERASRAAKMALAKMGEPGYLNEFVSGLKIEHGASKEDSISALGYIGNRSTAKYLAALLSDDHASDVPRSSHELGTPYSYLAEQALGEMFPEVLAEFQKNNPGKRFFFKDEWKKWWEKNKGRYQ